DYANSFNQALKNDSYISGSTYTPRYSQSDLDKYKSGEDPIFFPSVDWYKVMLKKTSSQQQHNLNINGGTDKVRYAISGGFFNQEGLFNNTDLSPGYDANIRYKRFNFRSNLNFTINKRFRAALDLSSQTENRSGNALNTQSVIENIARANPLATPGLVDGRVIYLTAANSGNPLSSLYQSGYQREYRNFLNGSIRLDHDLDFITAGLTSHAIVSYQNFNSQRFVNTKPTSTIIPYIPLRNADGTISYLPQLQDAPFNFSESIGKNRRITAELALDYKRSFGNHNVSGLLLYNQLKSIDPGFTFLVPNGYQSYVGRATYDYKNRYLAEVNIAYNGTENFAPGNRFGLFPAYSLGWVVSEESFFPKNSFMDLLKFRGSYGEVGNDQIGSDFLTSNNRFLYRPTAWLFTSGSRFGEIGSSYNLLGGVQEGRGSNPNLTWERAVKTNLGIEMSFWNRSISFTADVFEETRDNILATPQTVPSLVGVAIPALNFGKMRNRGYEFDLTLNKNIGTVALQVKANYSFARNKILFQDEVIRRYPYQFRTGQRFGQYFGLISEGFYNTLAEANDPKRPVYGWQNNKIQPRDLSYKDVNGNGKVDDFDQVPIGFSNIPEKTFGLSLVGQYKGFSVSLLFQGVDNVSIQYTRRFNSAFYDVPTAGAVDYLINSWTQERYDAGLPIQFPRFSLGVNGGAPHNYQSSTFFLADASYVRLKNAEIGYTFNGGLLSRVGLSSARLFANANNLVTWHKMYPGVDPESPPTATNLEPYPLVRTVNMGVNITF
ncbi:MAG: SusC/RagA family TonB-linked outer membrane protein, partial [Chitinophagaceae bacterium]